jgi:hypothetical protein
LWNAQEADRVPGPWDRPRTSAPFADDEAPATATATTGADVADLLLPRTDAGALTQAVIAGAVYIALLIAVRRNRDLMWFVGGLASLTFAWFALRTVH